MINCIWNLGWNKNNWVHILPMVVAAPPVQRTRKEEESERKWSRKFNE